MRINRNSWHYRMYVIGCIYPLEFKIYDLEAKRHEQVDVFSYTLTALCGLMMFPFFIIIKTIMDLNDYFEKLAAKSKVEFYGDEKNEIR